MKIKTAIFFAFAILYGSCEGLDDGTLYGNSQGARLENELLNQYPELIDKLFQEEIEKKLGENLTISDKKVFNTAVHQTKPKEIHFIDKNLFLVQASVDNTKTNTQYFVSTSFYGNSKMDFFCTDFSKKKVK